jgi:GTP-binding protein Era
MATGHRKFVSGFVSILGRPNAGKSTLLNALVGTKVAIVSGKPQTTRISVQAVLHLDHAQVVFLDTPGIHEGSLLIHRKMMESVREALEERDVLLYVADASEPFSEEDEKSLGLLAGNKAPVVLVLNKIDRLPDKSRLLPLIEQYRSKGEFASVIPASALTGEGLETLTEEVVKMLPEGPEYFPRDFVTDQPERYLAGEILREKVLERARQEVPHAVAVVVDQWEEKRNLIHIAATVFVEREGQKRIIIGAQGSMLKEIGTEARREIERLIGRKVFLEVFVKVRPDWRENPTFLNEIDWRNMAGR